MATAMATAMTTATGMAKATDTATIKVRVMVWARATTVKRYLQISIPCVQLGYTYGYCNFHIDYLV